MRMAPMVRPGRQGRRVRKAFRDQQEPIRRSPDPKDQQEPIRSFLDRRDRKVTQERTRPSPVRKGQQALTLLFRVRKAPKVIQALQVHRVQTDCKALREMMARKAHPVCRDRRATLV